MDEREIVKGDSMMGLGKIENVNPRDVWKDEARDFTPWLASEDGLALLGDALGVEIDLIATESRTGLYKADIVAQIINEDEERVVVIENQLDTTNHDHLGKIITYASGHNAVTCVWVASSFTDEHRQAMDWLNENMPDVTFFALEIYLIRIGNSIPAPQLKTISSPNEWKKAVRASHAKEVSEIKLDQLRFWQEIQEYANKQPSSPVQLGRTPRPQHWFNIAIGRTGFRLAFTVSSISRRVGCEIFMYDEHAKKYFDQLLEKKDSIETDLGYELEWQRLDDKKGSRIVIYREGLIDNENERQELIEWLYKRAIEFHRVFGSRIQSLHVQNLQQGGDGV